MAVTYSQLKTLDNDQTLIPRVEVAIWIAVNTIAGEAAATANHAQRIAWAQTAIANTAGTARSVLQIALAANVAANDTASIIASSDASIQSAVNNSIKVLAGITA